MSFLRALIAFPFAPSAAAEALRGRWTAMAAVLVAPLAAGLYLLVADTGPADAGITAGACLGVVVGLAAGGAAGCVPGRMVLGESFRARNLVPPCAVCAAWTLPLLLIAAWIAGRVGLGSAAALVAALAVLVWGTAAGIGILAEDQVAEAGKGLVAACMGLAGALAGAWLALYLVQATLVVPVIVPVDAGGLARGELLLVRRVRQADPGALVLLRDQGTGREVLARAASGGEMEPLGLTGEVFARGNWAVAGRAFFSNRRKIAP